MTTKFSMIRPVDNILVSFKWWTPEKVVLSIQGHPNACIDGAHKLCSAHFHNPWQFVRIEATSPMERRKTHDYQWLFTIEARLK